MPQPRFSPTPFSLSVAPQARSRRAGKPAARFDFAALRAATLDENGSGEIDRPCGRSRFRRTLAGHIG
jgi:hypothetical protein